MSYRTHGARTRFTIFKVRLTRPLRKTMAHYAAWQIAKELESPDKIACHCSVPSLGLFKSHSSQKLHRLETRVREKLNRADIMVSAHKQGSFVYVDVSRRL